MESQKAHNCTSVLVMGRYEIQNKIINVKAFIKDWDK